MEFLSPVHDILLWKLCINCNFYSKNLTIIVNYLEFLKETI